MTDYDANIYSWKYCNYYKFTYNEVDCSILNIWYSGCRTNISNSNPTDGWAFHTNVDDHIYFSDTERGCSYCDPCTERFDCTPSFHTINTWKPWYGTDYTNPGCRNDNFKKNVWEKLFTDAKTNGTVNTF